MVIWCVICVFVNVFPRLRCPVLGMEAGKGEDGSEGFGFGADSNDYRRYGCLPSTFQAIAHVRACDSCPRIARGAAYDWFDASLAPTTFLAPSSHARGL